MSSFICKVMTPQGQVVNLKLNEPDKIACMKKLKRNDMTPISIKKQFSIFGRTRQKPTATVYSKRKRNIKIENKEITFSNKVTLDEVKIFTEELYFLKKSKFTVRHAITTIINNTENVTFKNVLRDILKKHDSGTFIYKTMEEYKDIFPSIYINLIKNGELSGSLDDALKHAITYLEGEAKLKKNLEERIIPNIIFFVGIIILIFLCIVLGVPAIQNVLTDNVQDVSLPKTTLLISKICLIMLKRWYIIFALLIIASGIFARYAHTKEGNYKINQFIYRNSLFGKLVYLLDFSRIVRSIIINLNNNMRIQDALEVSKNVIHNSCMISSIEKSINNIYMSKSWIEPFEEENNLNPIILELLKKESTSKDIKSLEKTVEYMDNQIEIELNKLLNRLSKISLITISIVSLFFIFLILIPCVSTYLGNYLFL